MVAQITDYTRQVLDGLAQLIADAGLAVYHPGTAYAGSEIGIYFGAWPATSTRGVKLNAYQAVDRVTSPAEQYVQVATRVSTSYLGALDALDAVRDLLHRRAHFDLGQVRIALCVRTSTADLGLDQTSRLYEHTTNLRLTGIRWINPITT